MNPKYLVRLRLNPLNQVFLLNVEETDADISRWLYRLNPLNQVFLLNLAPQRERDADQFGLNPLNQVFLLNSALRNSLHCKELETYFRGSNAKMLVFRHSFDPRFFK